VRLNLECGFLCVEVVVSHFMYSGWDFMYFCIFEFWHLSVLGSRK